MFRRLRSWLVGPLGDGRDGRDGRRPAEPSGAATGEPSGGAAGGAAGLARLRPPRADVVLALIFSVAAAWFAMRGHAPAGSVPAGVPRSVWRVVRWSTDHPPGGALVALESLLVTIPLAWRRRWPLTALAAQCLAVPVVWEGMNLATFLAVLVGAYSLAAIGRHPVLSIGALLVIAAGAAAALHTSPPMPGWLSPFVVLLPIGLVGLTVRAAHARADAAAQRAEALRSGQEAATQTAVAAERARIARELHDVVSHHVSVMVIQAGAAGKVIDSRPDLAREALRAIEASGREAMGELRHLLGVLAPTGEDDLLHPQPGLDQLDALMDRVRSAGQPVTLRRAAGVLPRGVEIAAYRVVQEALTNALRYAPGARTEVIVERRGEELVVEVTDDGMPDQLDRAAPEPAPAGAGSGLIGLAERLRWYAGTLETGRRLGGGFRVSARIPLGSR